MRCCCGKKDIDGPIAINNIMHEPLGPIGNFCGPVDRHTIRDLLADNKRLKQALSAIVSPREEPITHTELAKRFSDGLALLTASEEE